MRFVIASLVALCVFGVAQCQESATPIVSLELTNADVSDALTTLSKQANVSMLADTTAKGKVTCSVSGLTVAQALDIICRTNKLEWYRIYTDENPGASLDAEKLLKLIDALRQVGATSVVCDDPQTQAKIVFLPNAASVDTTSLRGSMKLREVYVVRAIPSPTQPTTTKSDKSGKSSSKSGNTSDHGSGAYDLNSDFRQRAAAGDAKGAAGALWDVVKQMPLVQQYQTVTQLRNDFYKSLTPQQLKDLRNYQRQITPPKKPHK